MSEFLLKAIARKNESHSQLADLRVASQVPGVIYGNNFENQNVAVDYNELLKVLIKAGTSHLIILDIDGKETRVLARHWQQDPVTDRLTHIDFWAIDEKSPVTTTVPLTFVGVSKAVKEQGGKLNIKNDKVKVKCLPKDLPSALEIDLALLDEMGKTILVKDIPVAKDVKILTNATDPVVSVSVPKKMRGPETTVAATVAPTEAAVPAAAEKKAPEKKKAKK